MLSGYAVIRYINPLPATQTFADHLGNVNVIDPRNDIQFHRAMLHFRGWLCSPKIREAGYQFHKKFNAYAGVSTIGGSRTVMGSHPFWLANDRVMADAIHEYLQGFNDYPANTRHVRFNTHVIEVNRSPVNSLFGFDVGGQKGTTLSSASSFHL
jgi:hypothetical protein